jgi:hypothetical protein
LHAAHCTDRDLTNREAPTAVTKQAATTGSHGPMRPRPARAHGMRPASSAVACRVVFRDAVLVLVPGTRPGMTGRSRHGPTRRWPARRRTRPGMTGRSRRDVVRADVPSASPAPRKGGSTLRDSMASEPAHDALLPPCVDGTLAGKPRRPDDRRGLPIPRRHSTALGRPS